MPSHHIHFLLIILTIVGISESVMFKVESGQRACFYHDVETVGERLHSVYQVQKGGFLDIDFMITDPSGGIVYDGKRETSGRYTFFAPDEGTYAFCFGNTMSTVTDKTVNFDFEVGRQGNENEQTVAKEGDIDPINDKLTQIERYIGLVQEEQRLYRNRERTHRNTSEDTNARIMFWSVLVSLALIGMAVWQIFYLRRFFEVRRFV